MGSAPRLPRASASSSTFIRLLTQLSGADVADARQTFAEQLSPWLDWTDAIALSAALAGTPSTHRPQPRTGKASTVQQGCARVRADLVRSITADGAGPVHTAGQADAAGPTDDDMSAFSTHRRRYLAHQRTMADRIGPLRASVRAALSSHSPALGRLAALDAVFDEALAERERHLLSKVPALLEQRFERLRRAQQDSPEGAAEPWWAAGVRDMQSVLLAELDIRLQPIEGMVAALGHDSTRQP